MDTHIDCGSKLSSATDQSTSYSRQSYRTQAVSSYSSTVDRELYHKALSSSGMKQNASALELSTRTLLCMIEGKKEKLRRCKQGSIVEKTSPVALGDGSHKFKPTLSKKCEQYSKKDVYNYKFDVPEKDFLIETHYEITDIITEMSGHSGNDGKTLTLSTTASSLNFDNSMPSEPTPTYKYTLSELKEIEPLVSCLSFSSLTIGELENIDQSTPSKNHKYGQMWTNFKQEYVNLQQSLKLSRADTAILVSAKQKLQLSLQESVSEKQQMKRSLNEVTNQLAKLQSEIKLNETRNLLDEQRTESLNKSIKSEVQEQNNRIMQLTDEVERLKLDNSHYKQNEADLKRSLSILENEKSELTREVSSCSEVNLNLKSVIKECQTVIASDKEYITTLRTDRDNYAGQLYQSSQTISSHQLALKQLQKRCLESHNRNVALQSSVEELQRSVVDKDAEIERLNAQLSSRDTEKSNLDQLVTRLNKDVNRVENEFTKIKRNVVLNSEAASEDESLLLKLKSANSKLLKKFKLAQAESLKRNDIINEKKIQIDELQERLKTLTVARMSHDHSETVARMSHDHSETETSFQLIQAEKNISKICNDSPKTKDAPNMSMICHEAGGDHAAGSSQQMSCSEQKLASLQLIINDKESIVCSLEDKIAHITEQSLQFEENEKKLLQKVGRLEAKMASYNSKLTKSDADAEKLDMELMDIRAECSRLLAEKSALGAKLRQLDAMLLESEQKNQLAQKQSDEKLLMATDENSKLQSELETLTHELEMLKNARKVESERATQLLQSRTQDLTALLEKGERCELSREQLQVEINELQIQLENVNLSNKSFQAGAVATDTELKNLRELMTRQNDYITTLTEDYQEWAKKSVQHLNQSYLSMHPDACTVDLPRVGDVLQRTNIEFPDVSCESQKFLSNFRKLYTTVLSSMTLVSNKSLHQQQSADPQQHPTTHKSDSSTSSSSNHPADRSVNAKLKAYKQTVKVLRKQLQDSKQENDDRASLVRSCDSLSSCSSKEVQTDEVCTEEDDSSNVQGKIDELVGSHRKEIEECQKKRMLERAKNTKKLQETRQKINGLMQANEELRKTVDSLQVKESQSNKRLEMTQREKCRYRTRSRSLQASLKSMTTIASASKLDRILENNSNHSDIDSTDSTCEERTKHLDESVNEITKLLGSMRDNMFNLEKQVTEEGGVRPSNHTMTNGVNNEEGH